MSGEFLKEFINTLGVQYFTPGHVCMVLNGQRHMSRYLAEVIADLIKEAEREINIKSCVP